MSPILGIVAETAMNRTVEMGSEDMSETLESIFILLTTASSAAPRGSLSKCTSSISTSAMSLKKLKPPPLTPCLVTASNFCQTKEQKCMFT